MTTEFTPSAYRLRCDTLNALPMSTPLQSAWYCHLKDQPDEFWQKLAASLPDFMDPADTPAKAKP